MTLLIVDSSAEDRTRLRDGVRLAQDRVWEAEGPAEGLVLLARHRVATLVTDLWFPGGSALAMIKTVVHRWPEVLIVVTPGFENVPMPPVVSAALAQTYGADIVMPKPLDLAALAYHVQTLSGERQRLRPTATEAPERDRPSLSPPARVSRRVRQSRSPLCADARRRLR